MVDDSLFGWGVELDVFEGKGSGGDIPFPARVRGVVVDDFDVGAGIAIRLGVEEFSSIHVEVANRECGCFGVFEDEGLGRRRRFWD